MHVLLLAHLLLGENCPHALQECAPHHLQTELLLCHSKFNCVPSGTAIEGVMLSIVCKCVSG